MLNILIILALLATVVSLGLGLLSMSVGGSLDKAYGERFMWLRVGLQALAVALIVGALIITNA